MEYKHLETFNLLNEEIEQIQTKFQRFQTELSYNNLKLSLTKTKQKK